MKKMFFITLLALICLTGMSFKEDIKTPLTKEYISAQMENWFKGEQIDSRIKIIIGKYSIIATASSMITKSSSCSCSEWDCSWEGNPNSSCRRFCTDGGPGMWVEYKPCAYCQDPASLCPPTN